MRTATSLILLLGLLTGAYGQRTPYAPIPVSMPEEKKPDAIDDEMAYVNEVIPVDVRVRNPNVQCAWVAAEEVFVAAGYPQFKGWGESAAKTRRWFGASISHVTAGLDSQNVPYKVTTRHDLSIFDYARKERVGVYVTIPGHALVCGLLTDKAAYMINNYDDQNASKRVEKWSRAKFLSLWTGTACCPCNRKRPKPGEKPVAPEQPTQPATPAKPIEQPKPVEPGCKCPPPQDLTKITDGLNKLVDSVTAINVNVGVVNKSVGTLSDKVTAIDQRLTVAEGRLAASSPGSQPPPPSATVPDPNIKIIQDKLAALEANLKQSGTLHIKVTPK